MLPTQRERMVHRIAIMPLKGAQPQTKTLPQIHDAVVLNDMKASQEEIRYRILRYLCRSTLIPSAPGMTLLAAGSIIKLWGNRWEGRVCQQVYFQQTLAATTIVYDHVACRFE